MLSLGLRCAAKPDFERAHPSKMHRSAGALGPIKNALNFVIVSSTCDSFELLANRTRIEVQSPDHRTRAPFRRRPQDRDTLTRAARHTRRMRLTMDETLLVVESKAVAPMAGSERLRRGDDPA